MILRIIYLLIYIQLFTDSSFAQIAKNDYVINFENKEVGWNANAVVIELKGKKYKNLFLEGNYLRNSVASHSPILIEGKVINDTEWLFELPDSICQDIRFYILKCMAFDYKSNLEQTLSFFTIENNDSLKSVRIFFDEFPTKITASFVENENYELGPYLVGDSTYIDKVTVTNDSYLLDFDSIAATEMEVVFKSEEFGIRYNEEYKECLKKNEELVAKYPNSIYLINELNHLKYNYEAKSELNSIFNLFSDKIRKSSSGRAIQDYLDFNEASFIFENTSLQNTKNGKIESIIIDSSKYNLIMFSASWCGPCHKQIPILKDIYNEKNEYLNMIYISIDYQNTIGNWKNLLDQEKIPWRSLSLLDDPNKLKEKYQVNGIPYFILVSPQGRTEILNASDNFKKELYEKIK